MKFYTNVQQWGNQILVREIENGERKSFRVKYSPTLYVPCKEKSGHINLSGNNVAPVEFENIKEAKEFIKNYEHQPHMVFGMTNYNYAYISDTYDSVIDYIKKYIVINTIDIETKCENGFPDPIEAIEPILCITIKNHFNGKIMVFGTGKYKPSRPDVIWKEAKDEKELLLDFIEYWEKHIPDIITGWNTELFDLPYLVHRIIKVLGENVHHRLSPWGNVYKQEKTIGNRDFLLVDIIGVSSIDYLTLYKKITQKNKESFSLDHISFVELGKKKNKNPYKSFREWYTKDYQSFVDYNIMDVLLVSEIDDKLKFIDLLLILAYKSKINYEDVLSPVKTWDMLIYNFLLKSNVHIPLNENHSKFAEYEGAYVKEPIPGMYGFTANIDLESSYPHQIMQYNISPETYVGSEPLGAGDVIEKLILKKYDLSYLKERKLTICPNGAMYDISYRGFLPQLMEDMFNERKKYKALMKEAKKEYAKTKNEALKNDIDRYDKYQYALKILLNSAYGALGNKYFRYFNIINAEAITIAGQFALRWAMHAVNTYMNKILKTSKVDYIIYGDTDSIYVNFQMLVDKLGLGKKDINEIVSFLDKFCSDKLLPMVRDSYKDMADYCNAYEQKMNMNREHIATKCIWTAKKRYAMNVMDTEGVRNKEPVMKITGIEAVKSSTPKICRDKIMEALKIIMKMESSPKELEQFIISFRKEFMKLPYDDIAFPRAVHVLEEYKSENTIWKKGATHHVKAALVYNNEIKKRNLTAYQEIKQGDKIKFVFLKDSNPFYNNTMAFVTEIPSEFKADKYIDYEMQFEKAFTEPLKLVLDKINWSIDPYYGERASLDDYFS